MTEDETQPTTQNLFALADRLRANREWRDELKAALTAANDRIDDLERELSDLMVDAECGCVPRNGRMFVLPRKSYWSAAEGRTEDLYLALYKKRHRHLFSVHSNTLRSFLGEAVNATADENGDTHVPDWLAGLINSYDKPGVTVRQSQRK
jgi:hypothetical protein